MVGVWNRSNAHTVEGCGGRVTARNVRLLSTQLWSSSKRTGREALPLHRTSSLIASLRIPRGKSCPGWSTPWHCAWQFGSSILTAAFFDIVHSKDAWHFAFFVSVLAPVTLLVSVVAVMIPSRILLKRTRGWREIQSFWIAVASSVLGVVEPIALILLLAGKHLHMEL